MNKTAGNTVTVEKYYALQHKYELLLERNQKLVRENDRLKKEMQQMSSQSNVVFLGDLSDFND